MADLTLQLIEEITGHDETSFTTRNRVINQEMVKNLTNDMFLDIRSHFQAVNKPYGYFRTVYDWHQHIASSHGLMLRNMLKLRGRRNVLYVHNFAEASKDDDVATWSIANMPLNTNRVLAPAISNYFGYSDLQFYPVFNGDDTNYVKAVFDKVGMSSVSSTGQYRLGDNIILTGIPEGVKFDCVYFYGIERSDNNVLYSIDDIKADFSEYITDNCVFIDVYETQAARLAVENKSIDFEEEVRWSSTPKDNRTIFDYAFRASLAQNPVETIPTNTFGGQFETNARNMIEIAVNIADKIIKVF